MNDELTPSERADLRARIVGGAHDIKPVGAHRSAWVAGSLAAVLVVAIAGGVAVTSTLSAPPVATTPSPVATTTVSPQPVSNPTLSPTPMTSSTPSSIPVAPTVAFGGECSSVLSTDEARAFIPDVELSTSGDEIDSTPPSSRKVFALLGGLSCWWTSDQDGFGVTVVPRAALSSSLIGEWQSTLRCDAGILCLAEQTVGDLWVGVQRWEPGRGLTDQQFSDSPDIDRARAQAKDVLAVVVPRLENTSGVPQSGLPTPPVSACSAFDETLTQWTGGAVETGYPSDNLPSGPTWDIVVEAGVGRYCGWSRYPTDPTARTLAVKIYLQPRLGGLEREEREAEGLVPVEIPGASAAWVREGPGSPGTIFLVADIGGTRMTVAGAGQEVSEWVDLAGRLAEVVARVP
ncbi:hypothetical protein [uncultured Microbacterium sp.]|uniref:hypothetical protein n=1 Tax=uncultured Microbacterium sp. TaxID=191216 RepID=UPI0025FAD674|nr:hypothetical protein [uncultured Microbacterium sp.]